MKFRDMNTIELSNGNVIKSNLFESLLIASKTDKVTFRTTMLTCLLLDFDNDSEANDIVEKFMKEYMPNSKFEYVKDLRLDEFDFGNKFIKQMDSSFYKLYEKVREQVNIYNLAKLMKTLPI